MIPKDKALKLIKIYMYIFLRHDSLGIFVKSEQCIIFAP